MPSSTPVNRTAPVDASTEVSSQAATSPDNRNAEISMSTESTEKHAGGAEPFLRELLETLASLKLTVTLLSMLILLVLAGTLAQVDQEIWQVVDGYFRTFITYIHFQLFFPPSFFPSRPEVGGGFYFPGGWSLGALLAANLLTAHGLRFRPQAQGKRLAVGLGLIVAGAFITWLVIVSGANSDGLQAIPWLSWSALWNLLLLGLIGVCGGLFVVRYKLGEDRKQARRIFAVGGILTGLLVAWLISLGEAGRLDDSSMRILWQLMKGMASGLVLLAGCLLVFRKRGGVVLLHGGIGLLMFNELFVGLTAVEGRIQIVEGETVNYVQDIRHMELAIVDKSGSDADDVTVIPKSVLLKGQIIRHPDLPVDVRVDAFFQNSNLRPITEGMPNPATKGLGLQWAATEAAPISGTDTSGQVDLSAAYVTFLDKQNAEILGTHLVSLAQSMQELPENVVVNDKAYKVYLRFKREYKPYQLTLLDVRKDDYLGTDTPRNYSSDIRLVDLTQNIDQKVRIWMNNPLRYAGETFYQSSYSRDPELGFESTTLQVVTNTGWMIPYVACMIVATGMLTHFSITLIRFLKRRTRSATAPLETPTSRQNRRKAETGQPPLAWREWIVPACIVLALGVWVADKARPPVEKDHQQKFYQFGKIPVVYQGRAKPLDTLARNILRVLSDRQTFVDGEGRRQPAIRWLLDVMVKPTAAAEHKVFRVEHPEVLQTLGLKPREGFRYAFKEFEDHVDDLSKQARLARGLEPSQLTLYQKKLVEFDNKLAMFDLLLQSFNPLPIQPDSEHANVGLRYLIQQQELLARRMPPLTIPPSEAGGTWKTYVQASLESTQQSATVESESDKASALSAFNGIREAYKADDVRKFNSEVERYLASFSANSAADVDMRKIGFEAFFNHFEPFYYCAVLYVFVFLLTAASWLGWSKPLSRSAFWLTILTFVVHSVALVARIYISGRPPVTNLYSSAVFIGWGAVLCGILFEYVFRMGIGNVIAATSGFATLLIAHFLAATGDTMAVLQAVLDTQFWLATHVVCITLGYATTYVAGLIGLLYIVRGVLTPTLRPAAGNELSRMIYGTLCFATFFSFVGTVLGGLWADDSWGRFWGWDPKENGALIIVLWNALVLHARWGRFVQQRGLAVLAVVGNIAVSWSWFGVNELGIGLHSYGFTEGVLRSLGIFVLSQLILVAMGSMPLRWWWSGRRHAELTRPTA
jgi:ABC-type transport system involved in cytochrome c biogenesis permease subunit